MQQPYTQDRLVRYLYGETTVSESLGMAREISNDFSMRERFENLKEIISMLDCPLASPRESSISDLLLYSRNTAPLETLG